MKDKQVIRTPGSGQLKYAKCVSWDGWYITTCMYYVFYLISFIELWSQKYLYILQGLKQIDVKSRMLFSGGEICYFNSKVHPKLKL